MREWFRDFISDFKYGFMEKFTLFFSMGLLIINLLIFSLVMREAWILSLILAGVFLIYIPIGYTDKQELIWMRCSRILEMVVAVTLSVAYILLFGKFWLLFLPIIEIAGTILFYVFVYRKKFEKRYDDDYDYDDDDDY